MTKKEFYEEYVDNPCVTFDDIRQLIYEEELYYDAIDIKDRCEYNEWINDKISYYWNECGWEDLRDFLNNLDNSYDYYEFYDGCNEGGLTDYDIPRILKTIEEYLERSCDDWFSEEENDPDCNASLCIATLFE